MGICHPKGCWESGRLDSLRALGVSQSGAGLRGEHWLMGRRGAQAGRGKSAGEAVGTLSSPLCPGLPPIPDLISGCLSLDGAFSRTPQDPWGRKGGQIKGQAP